MINHNKPVSTEKLHQLTGLRYFAALLVFLSHLSWTHTSEAISDIFLQGFVGVTFFYMLSGFVLSYSYTDRLQQRTVSIGRYIALRIARIGPLHLATALPFVLLALWKADLDIVSTLANLTLMHSWVPAQATYFSLNHPSWSLSNELFFYVCFVPLILLKAHHRYYLMTVLILIVVVSASIVTSHDVVFFIDGEHTWAVWIFYINPVFRLVEFLVGMMIYDLWRRRIRLPGYFLPVAYGLMFTGLYVSTMIPWAFRSSLFFMPIAALFLFVHVNGQGSINAFLSRPWMRLLGEASFALYLLHQPMIRMLEKVLDHEHMPDPLFFLIALVVISLTSIAVHLYFERPVVSFLNRRIKSMHTTTRQDIPRKGEEQYERL